MSESDLWIDGHNVAGAGPTLESRNPADDSLVFCGDSASAAQVALAVEAAAAAQDAWARAPRAQREAVVRAFAAEVAASRDELAALIRREVGKLPSDVQGEINAVIAKAEITIEALRQRRGDADIAMDHTTASLRYRPLGTVVVLGPFNFPAHLPGGHIIPALLAGNAVVFKPSERSPAVGRWLVDAWTRAGLPAGVLNLIQGDATVARAAVAHHLTAGVFLTGGYEAGRAIHRQLAGRPQVLLALELGGNNPLVVVSPEDVSQAVSSIATSAFISSGQRCTCARRLIVVDDPRGRETIDALAQHVRKLRIGLPDEQPEPEIGPVISAEAAQKIVQTEARLRAAGAHPVVPVRLSGICPALLRPGLIDVTGCEELPDEEWFGPLLQIQRVANFEAAVQAAAATRFGLAAGLIGGTAAMFEEYRWRVGAGIVNWNCATTGASSRLAFGGIGDSGNHRPAGAFAVDFCNDPIVSTVAQADE